MSPDEVEPLCKKADEKISAALPVLERDFLIREAEAKALDPTQDSAQSESSDTLDISEGESAVAARFRASRDILDQCAKARANALAARSAAEFRLRWGDSTATFHNEELRHAAQVKLDIELTAAGFGSIDLFKGPQQPPAPKPREKAGLIQSLQSGIAAFFLETMQINED